MDLLKTARLSCEPSGLADGLGGRAGEIVSSGTSLSSIENHFEDFRQQASYRSNV